MTLSTDLCVYLIRANMHEFRCIYEYIHAMPSSASLSASAFIFLHHRRHCRRHQLVGIIAIVIAIFAALINSIDIFVIVVVRLDTSPSSMPSPCIDSSSRPLLSDSIYPPFLLTVLLAFSLSAGPHCTSRFVRVIATGGISTGMWLERF